MKLVNPMGRQAETLETGANYANDVARSGCVCYGGSTVFNGLHQGHQPCVCYCTGDNTNRAANMEVARIKMI